MTQLETPPTPYIGPAPPTMNRSEFAVRALIACGVAALVVIVLFLLWWSRSVFLMLFGGVTFGVFLQGCSEWITDRTKLSYKWALGIVVTSLLVILGLVGWLLGAQISQQFSQLAETLPESISQLEQKIEEYELGDQIVDRAQNSQTFPSGQKLVTRVTGMMGAVLGGVTAFVVIGFVGLYAAIEPRLYRKGLLHLVPKAHRNRMSEVLHALNESLRRWLVARIASMLIIGVLTSVGLSLLQVPMPLALGLLAFFVVAIPNLGPVLAAVPAILIAWTHGGGHLALQTVALYIGIETVESYILLPVLQKETVYLPPILSVIGVVFFGFIGGILGAFVASPLLVVLMVLVKMLYVEDALDDHQVEVHGET